MARRGKGGPAYLPRWTIHPADDGPDRASDDVRAEAGIERRSSEVGVAGLELVDGRLDAAGEELPSRRLGPGGEPLGADSSAEPLKPDAEVLQVGAGALG
jgi:hypothetical protein